MGNSVQRLKIIKLCTFYGWASWYMNLSQWSCKFFKNIFFGVWLLYSTVSVCWMKLYIFKAPSRYLTDASLWSSREAESLFCRKAVDLICEHLGQRVDGLERGSRPGFVLTHVLTWQEGGGGERRTLVMGEWVPCVGGLLRTAGGQGQVCFSPKYPPSYSQ